MQNTNSQSKLLDDFKDESIISQHYNLYFNSGPYHFHCMERVIWLIMEMVILSKKQT